MYDWNKDGKIDVADHWITYQIINYEKEKRETGATYSGSSYTPNYHETNKPAYKKKLEELSTYTIILIDIVLLFLLCMLNSCGA